MACTFNLGCASFFLLPISLQIKGLSGGERKRLNVACGCLPGPKLLLLDEPTTGAAGVAVSSVSQSIEDGLLMK